MAGNTTIEWATDSWNPVRGCSIVSPGCTNCYAMKQAHRFSGKGRAYEGLTKLTRGGPVWTGKVRTVPELLDQPLRWKKPRRIFVNSMSDLFHEDVPDEFIAALWWTMTAAHWHTFQILTKRAKRMQRWVAAHGGQSGWHASCFEKLTGKAAPGWRLQDPRSSAHIWLGVSVEDQARADERIPVLLQTPAAVRWISAEPLLGPVSLRWLAAWDGKALKPRGHGTVTDHLDGARRLDWVVVGGESGPGARPFNIQWARSIVSQCKEAGMPVFVKQLGAKPECNDPDPDSGEPPYWGLIELRDRKGGDPSEWPADLRVREYP